MSGSHRRALPMVLVALFLAMALGGQAIADATIADVSGADTTAAVGRAASSYLTGIRTYVAAALWNRIDPLMHHYYGGVEFKDLRYALTTIAIAQWLDPHATDSYYTGSFMLMENDRVDQGITMAERGVEANPRSGLLLMNLAQIRLIYQDDTEGAAQLAEAALGADTTWTDVAEKANAYLIMASVLDASGHPDEAAVARAEVERIKTEEADALEAATHDEHDE